MIRVVFVDVDDTLLSFSGYVKQSMREGFALFGLQPYEESMYPVFKRVNDALWQRIERGEISLQELMAIRWNRVFAALGIEADGEAFERYFSEELQESAIPEPEAMELLRYLSGRGYVLCAASNGPAEQQRRRLSLAGMAQFFSHVFVSSEVGVQKPERGFFDYCFRILRQEECPGLVPQQTLILGDSMSSDIAGGAHYGMHTILYRKLGEDALGSDQKHERELGERREDLPGPEHVVRRLAEVRQVL